MKSKRPRKFMVDVLAEFIVLFCLSLCIECAAKQAQKFGIFSLQVVDYRLSDIRDQVNAWDWIKPKPDESSLNRWLHVADFRNWISAKLGISPSPHQGPRGRRLFIIDFSDASCEAWSQELAVSCTLDTTIPRGKLAQIVRLAEQAKPAVFVSDIELAPRPWARTTGEKPADGAGCGPDLDHCLRESLIDLSLTAPVVAIRPFRTIPKSGLISCEASILDFPAETKSCGGKGTSSNAPATILFASPLIQLDADRVAALVHRWDRVNSYPFQMPGLSCLAAELSATPIAWPGEKSELQAITDQVIQACLRDRNDQRVSLNPDRWQIDLVTFSTPYAQELTMSSVHIVPAHEFLGHFPRYESAVKDAIVIVGGSYGAARDTYRTPIGQMPGFMVHANAIRSYQMDRHGGHESGSELPLKLCLAGITLFSAFFITVADRIKSGQVKGCWLFALDVQLFVVVAASLVAFVLVYNFDFLGAGRPEARAVAVITPFFAVTFEGLSSIVGELKRNLHPCIHKFVAHPVQTITGLVTRRTESNP